MAGTWAAFIPETETGDITLMRLRPTQSPSGPVVWRRTWDDPVHHLGDYARSLITDPAGNAIVVGVTFATSPTPTW